MLIVCKKKKVQEGAKRSVGSQTLKKGGKQSFFFPPKKKRRLALVWIKEVHNSNPSCRNTETWKKKKGEKR